ncbi:adhesion G protein-coupled receptor A3-like [Tubulanus polymorphus]|uniref:adhesion G protein-coupled receptor A3-like n=1 Tax=Tubulanus polymorphus TaxID=672921 RepID=UPI003DA46966
MMTHYAISLLLLWMLLGYGVSDALDCPLGCLCSTVRSSVKDESSISSGSKVNCIGSPGNKIQTIEQLQPETNMPLDTLILDLSDNDIESITPGAFNSLDNLVKLDLSSNRLKNISRPMFEGLKKLTRLSLSKNEIATIDEGTFDDLKSLKKLDFQSNHLICDCKLRWILRWSKNRNVRISDNTKCAFPKDLEKRSVRTLKKKLLHCNWPVKLKVFKLIPSKNQVVFEGDKLPFECQASKSDSSTRIVWIREGHAVETNRSAGIIVKTASKDRSVAVKSLLLKKLQVKNSGVWTCQVQTKTGNISKTVNIVVISDDTLHCDAVTISTNKGTFSWPKTVSGVSIEFPCSDRATTYRGKAPPHAFFTCNKNGKWENLDTTQCQYIYEMTRVLEQYTLTPLNHSNVAATAKKLKQYISDGRAMVDRMDIIFISKILGKLSPFVSVNPEVVDVILDIMSIAMLNVSDHLLLAAQKEAQACTRMVQVIEHIPNQMLGNQKTVRRFSTGIAFQAFKLKPTSFAGMKCLVASLPHGPFNRSNFVCYVPSNNSNVYYETVKPAASIELHDDVLNNVKTSANFIKLQFIVYKNGRLFPYTQPRDPLNGFIRISTPVISSKFSEGVIGNLSKPIVIKLRAQRVGTKSWPVYWDFTANGGLGGWISDGCAMTLHKDTYSEFECNHLTNFAVMQTAAPIMAILFMMEPIVYAGSLMCVMCLMAAIVTYITCHKFIEIPKKAKHSVVNFCISLMFLIIAFTMGINRTDHPLACQIIGVAIHYLSICTMFWITITTSNMYKKFTKVERPAPPPDEPLEGPVPPKPMLRFYLLGYGVPIIVCGITVAVNMDHYSSRNYCFLTWETSLGAFYGPMGLLLFINLILFLCTACVLRGNTILSPHDASETEAINAIELTSPEDSTNRTTETQDTASSILDTEHRAISQLRAVAAKLFLFLLIWGCAAFVVARPFGNAIPYQELIFSYAYGVLASVLGIFVVIYYCLSRTDARSSWNRFFCCKKHLPYDIPPNHPPPQQLAVMTNGHVTQQQQLQHHHDTTSLDSQSLTSKSASNANVNMGTLRSLQNGMTGTLTSLGGGPRSVVPKQSNINLVPSQSAHTEPSIHTQYSYPGAVPDIQFQNFYNARQNNCAKKYWDKRHRKRQAIATPNNDLAMRENRKSSSQDPGKRFSQGNASDGNNTHCSLEIQGYLKDRPNNTSTPFKSGDGTTTSLPPTPLGHGCVHIDRTSLSPTDGAIPVCPECQDSSPGGSITFPPPPPPIALVTPLGGGSFQKSADSAFTRAGSRPAGQPQQHEVLLLKHDQRPGSRRHSSGSDHSNQRLQECAIDEDSCEMHYHSIDNPPPRTNTDRFMSEIQQRVRPLSPAKSDITYNSKNSSYYPDSDSQIGRHHRNRKHRHHDLHHKHRKRSKQRWEEEFANKPKNAHAYAYIPDKMRAKVNSSPASSGHNKTAPYVINSSSSSNTPRRATNHFPRSVSAYEQMVNGILSNMEDDSLTSSSDGEEKEWIKSENESQKKAETSV